MKVKKKDVGNVILKYVLLYNNSFFSEKNLNDFKRSSGKI